MKPKPTEEVAASTAKPAPEVCPHCHGSNIFRSAQGKRCMNPECRALLGGQLKPVDHTPQQAPKKELVAPGPSHFVETATDPLRNVVSSRGPADALTNGRIA